MNICTYGCASMVRKYMQCLTALTLGLIKDFTLITFHLVRICDAIRPNYVIKITKYQMKHFHTYYY